MNFIDSLHVDNFRSLYQFQTEMRPFTVLIGRNDAGKTNIIKALQLLLNEDTTQFVDSYAWSRAAKSPRYPRQLQLTGQVRTPGSTIGIRRRVTIYKDQPAQSILQTQCDGDWCDITPEIALQLPILYYLKPRTGALQEAFDPKVENNIYSLIKEWMPAELAQERDLHKLMRGYAPDENNLAAYVKFMQEQVYGRLQYAFPSDFPLLQLNPDFRTPNDRGRLFVRELTHAGANKALFRLPLDHHGTGLISVVAMVLSVAVLRVHSRQNLSGKPLVFAIEEPEVHLHAQAQRTLLNYLQWLSRDHQTIVSTHSPLFVDRTDPQNVLVVRRASLKDEKTSKEETFWKAGTTRVIGGGYRNTWQEVRETLGVRLSDALMAGEFNLIVEGPTEEVLLPAMAKIWVEQAQHELDFDRVLIVCGEGGNLPHMAKLLLSTGNPTAVLVDGDGAGRTTAEQIKKERTAIEFIIELDSTILQPPLNTLPECEFEDFLDPQALLLSFNKTFSDVPGFDFLPLSFENFQREQQRLMGIGKPFGWIATMESMLQTSTKAAGAEKKQKAPKVDKRRLAEAVAVLVLNKTIPLPEFCDDLFHGIQRSLQRNK